MMLEIHVDMNKHIEALFTRGYSNLENPGLRCGDLKIGSHLYTATAEVASLVSKIKLISVFSECEGGTFIQFSSLHTAQ